MDNHAGARFHLRGITQMRVNVFASLSVAILIVLTAQNFLYSNFGDLQAREIDDLAFQATIARLHQNLLSGDFIHFMAANDYGYGWVYWAGMAFLTLPLKAIQLISGWESPIIVFPRMVSTVFLILTLNLIYKIGQQRGVDKSRIWIAILTLLSVPSIGLFAMRFGTVLPVLFFCAASLYFVLATGVSSKKAFVQSALAISLALAIKLSAAIFIPMLIVAWATVGKARLDDLTAAFKLKTIGIGAGLTLLLLHPPLMAAPFIKFIPERLIDNLRQFGSSSISLNDLHFSKIANFLQSHPLELIAALIGSIYLLVIANSMTREWKFFIRGLCMTGAAAFTLLTMVTVSEYALYSYTSPLMLMAVFPAMIHVRPWFMQSAHLLILGTLIFYSFQLTNAQFQNGSWTLNQAHYIVKFSTSQAEISDSLAISNVLGSPKDFSGTYFIDYEVPTAINQFTQPKACVYLLFDNLSAPSVSCPESPDYLILSKSNLDGSARSESGIENSNPESRTRRELVASGLLRGQHFHKIYESRFTLVYAKSKPTAN